MASHTQIDDEDLTIKCCAPLAHPIEVGQLGAGHAGSSTFFKMPILGPLLFENESSDARDHCANERTFLSYLRLSVYMAVVSVAIALSFHLKEDPSKIERHMALPLGALFWVLSLTTLLLGLSNYIRTVNQYSQKLAIVQSGWKTQLILGILAVCIVGTCIVLLAIANLRPRRADS